MNKKNLFLSIFAITVVLILIFIPMKIKNQEPNPSKLPIDVIKPIQALKDNIPDLKTYSNAGIEFKYPANWTLSENLVKLPTIAFPAGEIRISGDGYLFSIGPNSGFGEFPSDQYKTVQVKVENENIAGVEQLDNLNQRYALLFALYRPGSNEFYFIRLSGSLSATRSLSEVKQRIMDFVDTIKIVN